LTASSALAVPLENNQTANIAKANNINRLFGKNSFITGVINHAVVEVSMVFH
jgi:hypothetical protein